MTLIKTSLVDKEQIPKFILENKLYLEDKIEDTNTMIKFLSSVLDERKAIDIKYFNIAKQSKIVDHIICATHTSTKSISALAKYLRIVIKRYSIYSACQEGSKESTWIAILADTIMIHLFTDEGRKTYNIEELLEGPKEN